MAFHPKHILNPKGINFFLCFLKKIFVAIFVTEGIFFPSFGTQTAWAEIDERESILEYSDQDFSWGVLAMNAEKAVYQAGEQVNLAMAVLDGQGNMDCKANLQLLVERKGENRAALFTTANGGIKVNPECRLKQYVAKPDFEASFAFAKSGDYRLTLTALTVRGARRTSQTFKVGSAAAFEIKRQAPTRLYPAADYPVNITVTAGRDFSGIIEEQLPVNFQIVGRPRVSLSLINELAQIVGDSSGRPNAPPKPFVADKESGKVIAFPVALKSGESATLSYTFHAPPKSPEFYTLGPLHFKGENGRNNFTEPRAWQLANDAIAFRATSTAVAAASGNITMTVPAGTVANDIMVAVITSDDNVSLSFPANSGWTKEIQLNNGAAQRTTVAWKRATTTETGFTYVVTHSSGNSIISTVSSFSGAITSGNPFEATSTSLVGDLGKDFTVTTTPITTQTAGDMIILAYGWGNDETMNNASYACDDPAALTEAFDNLTSLGSDSSAMMAYGIQSNTGSTGICNATSKQNSTGADTSISMALALKPAPTLITVSGNIYSNEGTTPIACNASSTTVVLEVNGTTRYTGSCTLATGAYSIGSVSISSGDVLTVYIGSATVKGAAVTKVATSNISDLNIYQNTLIVRSDNAAAVTNDNLGKFDKDNDSASLFFTSNSNNLSLDSNFELHVWTGDIYSPGGTVTTQGSGDLHTATSSTVTLDTAGNVIAGNIIAATGTTANINADTTIGKGISAAGSALVTYSGTPTVTFSGTGTLITTSTTISLYNFLTSGSGTLTISASTSVAGTFTTAGTGTVTDNASTTIVGAISIGSGTTLNGTGNIIMAGGASGAGTVTMTGGTVELQGTNNLNNSASWTFNNLGIGTNAAANITSVNTATVTVSSVLTVASGDTLNAGVKSFVLSGSGAPFVVTSGGTFTASTSLFSFQETTGTTTVPNLTYYNLDFSPSAGAPVYQFAGTNTFFLATDTSASTIYSLAVYSSSTNSSLDAIYAGSNDGGFIYKCLASTGCTSAGNWTTATDTSAANIYSLAVDSTNGAIYAGSGTDGFIYKCLASTGCASAGNWTTATDTAASNIESLAVDSTNGAIYAGSDNGSFIYKCVTSTGCTSAGNWTTATDTPAFAIYSLAVYSSSTNSSLDAIYAGSGIDGFIYKCLVSTGCTSAGNWTTATDTSASVIYSLAVDSTNGAIYAGSDTGGFIYKCLASTGCASAGNWTIATDTSASTIYSLAVDSTNGAIYAGSYAVSNGGIIYKCVTSTGCTSAGNWTTATDTSASVIYSLAVDSTNGAIYAVSDNGGFIYKDNLNQTININNNLSLNGIGNETVDAQTNNVAVIVGGTLTVGSGDTFSASASTTIANLTNSGAYTAGATTTVSGTLSNSGTFTHNSGTVIFNGSASGLSGSTATTFYNLQTSGTGTTTLANTAATTTIANVLTIGSGTVLDAGVKALAFTATGTPLTVSGTFTASSSTVSFQGTTGTTTPAAVTYYNLDFSPISGTPVYSFSATGNSGNTGLLSPTATGEDYNQWTNPTYAYSSNDQYTQDASTSSGNKQDYYNFNFNIPAGSTISGIDATIEAYNDGVTGTIGLEMSWDGGLNYTSTGTSTPVLTGSDTVYTRGGPAFTWGRTWSSSDFSNSNFRLRINNNTGSLPGSAMDVDQVQVRVYYALPSAITISNNLTANGAGNEIVDAYTNNSALTIGGNFTINSGDTFLAPSSSSFTLSGNFANSGTFTHNSGTVTFGGTTQNITGTTTFYNLTLGAGTTNLTSVSTATMTVANILTINSGKVFNAGAGAVAFTATGTPFVISGTFTASTSLISYQGAIGTTTVASTTYYNLDFSPSSGNPVFLFPAGTAAITGTSTFATATSTATYTVPAGITSITVKAWGGGGSGGGGGAAATGGNGGGGGFAQATLSVTPNESLNVYVGGGGGGATNGGGGGGYSAVTRGAITADHSTVLIQAGGGGGGGRAGTSNGAAGGAGGGVSGVAGGNSSNGNGGGEGTASSGGNGGTGGGIGLDGTAGSANQGGAGGNSGGGGVAGLNGGGDGATTVTAGAGGAGGYFGGGGGENGTAGGGGGGGGSSFASGTATSTTAGSGVNPGNSSDPDRGSSGAGSTGGPISTPSSAANDGKVVISYSGIVAAAGSSTITNSLTIGGAGSATIDIYTNNVALTVGNLTIGSTGTFLAATSATTTLTGNLAINGAFTYGSSTLAFAPTSTSTITSAASVTFNNISITSAGKELRFQASPGGVSPVFTIAGTFVASGSPNNLIILQSDTSGTKWLAHFNNPQSSITYVYIKDSGCDGGSSSVDQSGNTNTNGGNNGTCWFAAAVVISPGGGGGNGGPTPPTEPGSQGSGSTQTGGNPGGSGNNSGGTGETENNGGNGGTNTGGNPGGGSPGASP